MKTLVSPAARRLPERGLIAIVNDGGGFRLGIALMLLSATLAGAQELTGGDIVKRATEVVNQDQARSVMELTITTTTGQQRTFVYESFSRDRGEKVLMHYLEPARVKGQATLMLNNADDIWVYFPRTRRVRKLATHAKKQKMEGSDFAYEDMGGGDTFLDNFTHKRLDDARVDGVDCYVVQLDIKPDKTSSYSRLLLFVAKEDFVIRRVDYYDEKDPDLLNKRLTISDVRNVQGVPTPMTMVMHSLIDDTESAMKMREVDYNVDLPEEMFTERGLRQ